jgi:ligand-binding sensor domain-containing protein
MHNPDATNAITEDRQGRILTSSGSQVLRWENGAWNIFDERQGIVPYGIGPVFVNPAGEVWLASSGHGLSRWLGYNLWETWTSAEGLAKRYIWGVLRDRTGRLWVGNDNGVGLSGSGRQKIHAVGRFPDCRKEQRVSGLVRVQGRSRLGRHGKYRGSHRSHYPPD